MDVELVGDRTSFSGVVLLIGEQNVCCRAFTKPLQTSGGFQTISMAQIMAEVGGGRGGRQDCLIEVLMKQWEADCTWDNTQTDPDS